MTMWQASDVVRTGDTGDGGSGSNQFGADRLGVERGQRRGTGPDNRGAGRGRRRAVGSRGIAIFRAHPTLSTQTAAFHERRIQALSTAAGAYGSAEAANASPLQQALNVTTAHADAAGSPADRQRPVPAYPANLANRLPSRQPECGNGWCTGTRHASSTRVRPRTRAPPPGQPRRPGEQSCDPGSAPYVAPAARCFPAR